MGSSPAPEIKVKITGEDTGVSAAIKELGAQLQQLKRTQDETGTSARRMGEAEAGAGRSMREAREGAKLLSEETGVHLNRGLTGIIARSSTLGPLLNAAFPVAAAIGFGEVIVGAAEKFSSLIADTFIFTDAMKEAYKAQVSINTEIAKRAEHVEQLDKAYQLIGLKGTDREVVELRQKGEEIDKVQKKISDFENKRGAARLGVLGTGGSAVTFTDDDQAQLGNEQSKLKELQKEQFGLEKQTMTDAAEKQAEISKLRLGQIEAGFANELSLYKAQHSKVDQDNEASYVKGLESLAQYFDRRKQLAAEASQKEIDALTAERHRVLSAPTRAGQEGEPERIANQTKAAALANQIAIAKVNAAKTTEQLTNEQEKKQDELDKKVIEFQGQIARAQGLRFDEASERIAAEAKEMADKLREAGIAPDQIDAMVAKFKAAATQQAQFAGAKASGQGAIAALTDDEEDIRLKNLAIVADVKIAELERARIPALQALAAQLKASAVGPEQIREADDFARSVDRIAEAAKKSAVSVTAFKDQATQAIKGDLTTFLGSTITQARNVGQAFAQLGNQVVASIQRIVAQLLIQIVTQKLVKAITHEDSGAAGVATAAAKGTAQAAPLIVAAGAMTASGATIAAAGIGLGISATALQIAADTLIIANATGGGLMGHAEGGLITGPGTGTSDSIPARLSTGEFVVRAAAVRAVGLDTLAMINRGLRVPSISGMSIPRFAEGGLVTHGSGSNGVDLSIGLDLAEGLILKHLSSKKAEKIILSHVGNNPKAVSKALSRGQS
jgi:hypothetical protein